MEASHLALLSTLLGGISRVHITGYCVGDAEIELALEATTQTTPCPDCGRESARVRGRYWRTLHDLPWAARTVRLRVCVRKFACDAGGCPRRVFAERLPQLPPYARCTPRLSASQLRLGLALGGEAGARLGRSLYLPVSAATLLRRLRRMPAPAFAPARTLGVDDFAFRKGRRYGTLLVDLDARRPIELLPDRTSGALGAWLQGQPQVEVVSRDRSTEYARGAAEGAPQAAQVADRFHLLSNLREGLQSLAQRHGAALAGVRLPSPLCPTREALAALPSRSPTRGTRAEEAARERCQQERAERHRQIHQMRAEGASSSEIARRMRLNRKTVCRYLRLDAASAALRRHRSRSGLDPYLPYLAQRWAEGCHDGMRLWREIAARGYEGTHKMVTVWAQQQRTEPAPTTPDAYRGSAVAPQRAAGTPPVPSARSVAFLLIRRPESLSEAEAEALRQVREASPEVAQGHSLAQGFAGALRARSPEALARGVEAMEASPLTELQNFAAGLRRDWQAVEAAASEPWSNGQTEGQVNRLKMLKRQMYGRARFDLLRRRVLYG